MVKISLVSITYKNDSYTVRITRNKKVHSYYNVSLNWVIELVSHLNVFKTSVNPFLSAWYVPKKRIK